MPRPLAAMLCQLAAIAAVLPLRGQESPPATATSSTMPSPQQPQFVCYRGEQGPLHGKRIVLVAGDEEYRSEQSLPQLARILAVRLGAECHVRWSIDRATGAIDPTASDNIPGLDVLDRADLLVLFVRFRALATEQMRHVVDYVLAGKPIVALRTSTHAFAFAKEHEFAAWSWNAPDGGFGRRVLGETWIDHHGRHGVQGTRAMVADGAAAHPILRGVDADDVWDPADVYRVRLPLPDGCTTLLSGTVLATMAKDSLPASEQPERMPIAWIREWKSPAGPARVFTTTIGSAATFGCASTRRLLVNACFWAMALEDRIADDLDVGLVGDYAPRAFGFGKEEKGVMPAAHAWPAMPMKPTQPAGR